MNVFPRPLSAALLAALASASAGAQDYTTAFGAWRGPLQFNLSAGGERDPAAHRLAPVVIEVSPDGSVRGVSTDSGCKFLGLAGQITSPRVLSLDVTVSGCADARFNQRYSGTLSVNGSTKEAGLTLRHVQVAPAVRGMKAVSAQLAAALRR